MWETTPKSTASYRAAEAGAQGAGSKSLAEPGAGAQGEMPSVKRPRQDTMTILGVFLES